MSGGEAGGGQGPCVVTSKLNKFEPVKGVECPCTVRSNVWRARAVEGDLSMVRSNASWVMVT